MKIGDYVCEKTSAEYGNLTLYKIKAIEGDIATVELLPGNWFTDQFSLSEELIPIPQAIKLALDYYSEMEATAEFAIAELYTDMKDYETDPEKFIKDHIPQED